MGNFLSCLDCVDSQKYKRVKVENSKDEKILEPTDKDDSDDVTYIFWTNDPTEIL